MVFGLLLLLLLGGVVVSVRAGEYEDARVAFGAFDDGLYGFARQEFESFLKKYPASKLHDRVCLLLALASLEGRDCRAAAAALKQLGSDAKCAAYGIDPAELRLQLGLCHLRRREVPAAEKNLRAVLKLQFSGPAAARARFELARIYFTRSDDAALLQAAGPLLPPRRPSPALDSEESASLLEMAALAAYRQRAYDKALTWFEALLARKRKESTAAGELRQELYALAVECAWHLEKSATLLRLLAAWRRSAGRRLDLEKLNSALLQVTGLLRRRGGLERLEPYLEQVLGASLPAPDRRAHYRALVEIARRKHDRAALRRRLARLTELEKKGSCERLRHLKARLELEAEVGNWSAVAALGGRLEEEDGAFWSSGRPAWLYLVALGKEKRCRKLVARVPARLPPWAAGLTAAEVRRRLTLARVAVGCLVELERWPAAAGLLRRLYRLEESPGKRLSCLAQLARLAGRLEEGAATRLNQWLVERLAADFPLDHGAHAAELRRYPELELLMADDLYRRGEYRRALPMLLRLEKLKLKNPLGPALLFRLAETLYQLRDFAGALSRYRELYRQSPGLHDRYRRPAALRLVACYERLAPLGPEARRRLKGILRYLVAGEKDSVLRRQF